MLADDVYERLKTSLMDHAIAPGERMNIDGLGRTLGVSPTPVREALARLESEGLVTKEPLKGYSATPLLDRRQFEDLYELRLLLEPWAAAQASEQVTFADQGALERELASCPAAPAGTGYSDYRTLSAHDRRFHDLVAQLAGNAAVRSALDRTHFHLHVFRLYYRATMGDQALEEHERIVAAIRARDPRGSRDAMREHLEISRERLRAFVP